MNGWVIENIEERERMMLNFEIREHVRESGKISFHVYLNGKRVGRSYNRANAERFIRDIEYAVEIATSRRSW